MKPKFMKSFYCNNNNNKGFRKVWKNIRKICRKLNYKNNLKRS